MNELIYCRVLGLWCVFINGENVASAVFCCKKHALDYLKGFQ